MPKELEAKYPCVDEISLREKLTCNGFKCVHEKILIKREVHHLPKDHEMHTGTWGRVRDEGDKITAAIKTYLSKDGKVGIEDVEEEEIEVASFEEGQKWLESRGMSMSSYQESYREKWLRDTAEVCIDTWPGLSPYAEVEAPTIEEVMQASKDLELDFEKALYGGSDAIYMHELGLTVPDLMSKPGITFDDPPKRKK